MNQEEIEFNKLLDILKKSVLNKKPLIGIKYSEPINPKDINRCKENNKIN